MGGATSFAGFVPAGPARLLSRLLLGIDSGEYRNRCAALHAIEAVLRPQEKETTIAKIKERRQVEDTEAVRCALDVLLSHLKEGGAETTAI